MSDWNPTPPGWRPVEPAAPRAAGKEAWRMTKDGQMMTCELHSDERAGAGWEVVLKLDDEWLFGWRDVCYAPHIDYVRRETVDAHLTQKLHTAQEIYARDGIGGVYRVLRSHLSESFDTLYRNLLPTRFKESHELAYWIQAAPQTNNSWYVTLFTTHFGLMPAWYAGKRILDIGCGPLGSLEWADLALERVGLDPLARKYQQLGASHHKMTYVAAPSEHIPFEDRHFDVVSSFNSLDHVASVPRTIDEIIRVLKRGGLFLLITELNHHPTPTEPQTFGGDIVDRFQPALELIEAREYEKSPVGVYTTIDARQWFDRGNPAERPGVVSAKFRRRWCELRNHLSPPARMGAHGSVLFIAAIYARKSTE